MSWSAIDPPSQGSWTRVDSPSAATWDSAATVNPLLPNSGRLRRMNMVLDENGNLVPEGITFRDYDSWIISSTDPFRF